MSQKDLKGRVLESKECKDKEKAILVSLGCRLWMTTRMNLYVYVSVAVA